MPIAALSVPIFWVTHPSVMVVELRSSLRKFKRGRCFLKEQCRRKQKNPNALGTNQIKLDQIQKSPVQATGDSAPYLITGIENDKMRSSAVSCSCLPSKVLATPSADRGNSDFALVNSILVATPNADCTAAQRIRGPFCEMLKTPRHRDPCMVWPGLYSTSFNFSENLSWTLNPTSTLEMQSSTRMESLLVHKRKIKMHHLLGMLSSTFVCQIGSHTNEDLF